MKNRIILLLGVVLMLTACKDKKLSSKNGQLDELHQLMQGSFDSSAQANEDKSYYDITLHMYPIWQNIDGPAKYLYVEQSVTTKQEKPYRQRVYKLEYDGKANYISTIYKLPNEEQWVMAWKDSRKWDALKPTDLELREGCEVYLKRIKQNIYEGSTKESTCKSSLRGASYATSKVTMSKGKIYSWDQGFDDTGKQVWGAEKGGYIFLKKAIE